MKCECCGKVIKHQIMERTIGKTTESDEINTTPLCKYCFSNCLITRKGKKR
jgi:hypothetical protein